MMKAYLSSETVILFLTGGISVPLLCRIASLQRMFIFIHVLEHEIVHGLTAILCGGSFVSLTAGLEGGSAYSTKDNFFVRLAPYVLALFSVSIIFLTFFLVTKFRFLGIYLSGLFYVNFLFQTFKSLAGQPDIKRSGGVLTYPLLGFINVSILFGILSLVKSLRI